MEQPRNDLGQYITWDKHFAALMDEREKAHKREHELIDGALKTAERLRAEAIEEARDVVDARLEHLNELRDEVMKDRNLYVTRTEFDLQVKPLQRFRDKALGFGTLLSIVSAVTGAVVTALVLGVFG